MSTNKGLLIIFSGLPGSGKSTLSFKLAEHLSATYVRIDTIEQGLKDVCGITQIDGMGYRLSYWIAEENLRVGNIVLAESVNGWPITRNEWNDVAKKANAPFLNVEIICSDRVEHKRRVESRMATIPGHVLPTWEEVLDRDYKPWNDYRIILDTSGKSVAESFQELLIMITANVKTLRLF